MFTSYFSIIELHIVSNVLILTPSRIINLSQQGRAVSTFLGF